MSKPMTSFDSVESGATEVVGAISYSEAVAKVAASRSEAPAEEPASEDTWTLASGRTLTVQSTDEGDDEIRISGCGGTVELHVVLTPRGPVLKFESAAMKLESAGKIEVDCDRLHLRSKRGIVQETGGDLIQHAGGNAELAVRGDSSTVARSVELTSRRGDVRLRANDDVKLNGERVRLNC